MAIVVDDSGRWLLAVMAEAVGDRGLGEGSRYIYKASNSLRRADSSSIWKDNTKMDMVSMLSSRVEDNEEALGWAAL
ncbi:hypothetical protein CRG98_005279 [Punica granatum]|uniref:Uncharacterized protein n=1 Tax=Punica granatum TaxID=22663 RepID=A0A2I0L116_PUNGR|nr:hypothetical protein CRG98_005279 [Punica granatum]